MKPKDHPLVRLSAALSGGRASVVERISYYLENKQSYFDRYEDELCDRFVEEADDLSDVIVLVDALSEAETIAYLDHKCEYDLALQRLSTLSGGQLAEQPCYDALLRFARMTEYGLGAFLEVDKHGPQPFDCVKAIGKRIIGIDEGSDCYILLLVDEDALAGLAPLSKEAGIRLLFTDK